MKQIKIKRTYDEPTATDGYRVLIDKMWPRGIKKADLSYDYWAKNIAPSTELREWFHQDIDKNWNEFHKKYMEELKDSPGMKDLEKRIKKEKIVTLLYSSKNVAENNAVILREYLEKALA